MSQDNELRRLEQFVEKLLGRFNDLREEKSQLQQKLTAQEKMIGELRRSLAVGDEERSKISQRVGKMVEQIEAWESGLDDEGAVEVDSVADISEEEGEEPPRSVAERRTEEEGRIQHNLFSLGAASR
jgi:septal ring factor EnvC (AmiA/AmiB activator)